MSKKVSIRLVRDDDKEFIIDQSEWAILSDGLEGIGSIDNNISYSENAFGDGVQDISESLTYKDRTVRAEVRNAKRNEELRQKAVEFFITKKKYKMYITYMGVTRYCEGSLHKFYPSEGNIYKPVNIQFTIFSESPYLKSTTDFGKDIAAILPMAGFPYINTTKGIPISVYNFEKKVKIVNAGHIATGCRAVFKFTGEVINPELIINDKYVRMLATFQADDVLEMDFTQAPVKITKNGLNFIGATDRTSNFDEMDLVVGTNTIAYEAENGDSNMSVSIYYHQLFGSI